MKINKTKNLSKNIAYGFIYKMISMFFPFFIRTIIIQVLSSEYLGLSSLFTSILQALNLIELGLGSALVFNMYDYVAKNDKEKICNYLSFYKKCYKIIGIIILIIGIIIMPFIKYFISGTYPSDINIYILYFIYLINTVLNYCMFSYKNSVALAYQRIDIENKILCITQTILYILQIILLLVFKNYYIYIVLLPIFTILKNILISFKINSTYPDIKAIGMITKNEQQQVVNNIKNLFGHQIAFTVINSADNIILSAMLGLHKLTIYNNYYYIFNALVSICTLLFSSIQAGIGNSIIVDRNEVVYNNYKRFRRIVYSLVCIISICMFCLYQPFMKIWMGESMMLNKNSMLIFVLGFYITQVRRVVTTYKNAAGMWKDDFLKPYIVIIVDIVLDIILIPIVGVIGAMIATIISMGLIAIPWENYILHRNLLKKELKEQYVFMFKEFLILVISLYICDIFVNYISITGIYGIVIKGISAFLIALIINIVVHKNSSEGIWIKQRLILFIKNRK